MKSYSITDFGAKENMLCTQSIQKAIDTLFYEGGGVLLFPKGVYVTGTLNFKSDITYHFEHGSRLKGSLDIDDYHYNGFWHNEMGETLSLISALNERNIVLEGAGVIDLSHEAFEDFDTVMPFQDVDPNTLSEQQRGECVVAIKKRPNQPAFFESCENVIIRDLTFLNSPCWTITFSRSRNIKINGITIHNSMVVANSDGIHLCASKDVTISDCNIAAGDDCVAITCITAEGKEDISERITISNCNFQSSSAGVRIGHAKGKVRNVCVSNVNIENSNRGIAIFAGDEGYVENVLISNLNIHTRMLCGAWWGKGEPLVICAANSSGKIANIKISHINMESNSGMIIAGKDKNIRNVTLSDVNICISKSSNHALMGGYLDLRPNDYIKTDKTSIPYLYVREVENLKQNNVGYSKKDNADYSVEAIME